MGDGRDFDTLLTYLRRVPAIREPIHCERTPDGEWWVKFPIDIEHPLAWHVVQECAYVLNELSLFERLPTVFKPTSPPPYLNGGPKDYLMWVVECDDPAFKPGTVAGWLEGRLPRPVEDLSQWRDDS